MEQTVALVALATLSSKLVDVLRYLRAKDWNASFTQVVTWISGILLTFAASAANIFGTTVIPGLNVALNDLDSWSKVLVGASLASLLSKVVDLQKAFDGTQSAAVPPLLPPPSA